jgi:DNA invertase Pin-like site-specific DNA recombinase
MEHWAAIDGFPAYEVSNQGYVRRTQKARGTRPRILKNSKDRNGYAVVNLHHDGKQSKHYVHRLVAHAFVGGYEQGLQVAHYDGDAMNAHFSNLRWATQSSNEVDKKRHGRDNYPPKGSRILSANDIDIARELLGTGQSLRSIASKFGTNHTSLRLALKHGSAKQSTYA